MSEPFLCEIRIFSFPFAPKGWAQCNGQLLPVNQNQALFTLLGATYGGDGKTTFALPDFRGRAAMHVGNSHTLGERGGEQAHTLTLPQLPEHAHTVNATTAPADTPGPILLAQESRNAYAQSGGIRNIEMSFAMIRPTGGSQPHQNMQPYLALNICICLQGIFPSPN